MPSRRLVVPGLVLLLLLVGGTATAIQGAGGPRAAVSGGFTYQGRLEQGGAAHDGSCDFQFRLYDAESGGSQVGTTQTATRPVSQGVFTASLDFGAGAFEGSARYLEVQVRCPAGSGGYQTLSPRQALSPAPYALYALNIPLAGSGVASTAARSDHDHAGAYQGKYARTVVVGPVGTDAAASGTALLAALAGIADAGASKPYLLKLEPGVYDLGSSPLTMKAYVDVEGSGEGVTRVTRAWAASTTTGTVEGASQAELRSLTVESAGGSEAFATGFYSPVGTAPRLTHVTLIATGSTFASGIYNETGAAPRLVDVHVTASAGWTNHGIHNQDGATPVLERATVSASGGGESAAMYSRVGSPASGAAIEIRDSDLTAGGYGVYSRLLAGATGTMLVRDSQISGHWGMYSLTEQGANATIRVRNAEITGSHYGVFNYYAPGAQGANKIYIDGSRVKATYYTIYNANGFEVRVANSLFDGGPTSAYNGGSLTCNFVSNGTYNNGGITACP